MSYKLRQLQQKLSKSSTPAPEAPERKGSGELEEAVSDMVAKRVKAAVTKAEEQQAKAEARCVEMQKALDAMVKEHSKEMKELYHKMESAKGVADSKLAAMDKAHGGALKDMQAQLSSLQSELAGECLARAKAEASKEAMEKSYTKMEKMMQKPAPAPAVQPVAPKQAPTPMQVRVSQRDGNGRIMSLTIEPSS